MKSDRIMVKTKDGRLIDRAKAFFRLQVHNIDSSLLRSATGTVYRRDGSGTYRKIDADGMQIERMSKSEKKAEKRRRRDARLQAEMDARGASHGGEVDRRNV